MIEEHVNFNSNGLKLEGILSYDENTLMPQLVLLCAPHPHLGGDMENNVITAFGTVLAKNGFAALRFNYRGVGGSESRLNNIAEIYEYWEEVLNTDNYSDAQDDAVSALDYLKSAVDGNEIYVVGYSFGAVVTMRLGFNNKDISAFASISLPFGRFDTTFLSDCKKPKLFICTDNDFATSIEEVEKGMLGISEPKILDIIDGCDHFYIDKELEIANKVLKFFKDKKNKDF